MTEPIVTSTGYSMLTQDQLLTEVQRLEGLVASVTAERDDARDIAVRSGYFVNAQDAYADQIDQVDISSVRYEVERPSAYDMPVGSVVDTEAGERFRRATRGWQQWFPDDEPISEHWGQERVQSGWIEGLFSDGLVTEWRLP